MNLRKKVSSLQTERNSLLEKISKDRTKARNELLKNLKSNNRRLYARKKNKTCS